jgi:hypothetical protein
LGHVDYADHNPVVLVCPLDHGGATSNIRPDGPGSALGRTRLLQPVSNSASGVHSPFAHGGRTVARTLAAVTATVARSASESST